MPGTSETHDTKGAAHDRASTSTDGPMEAVGREGAGKRPRRPLIILAAVAAIAVILGLALGLGLGLGLRHSKSAAAANPTGNSTTTNLQNVTTPSSADALLSADMVNDAPTTRTYDFVVEERMGAPDGVQKHMLVVNGQYPGPTIEANSEDRIVVNVTNKMPNST